MKTESGFDGLYFENRFEVFSEFSDLKSITFLKGESHLTWIGCRREEDPSPLSHLGRGVILGIASLWIGRVGEGYCEQYSPTMLTVVVVPCFILSFYSLICNLILFNLLELMPRRWVD